MGIYSTLLQALRTVIRNARRSLISISAAAFGVALTLLMLGVADGSYNQVIRDATRMQSGQVTLQNPKYLESGRVEDSLLKGADVLGKVSQIPGVERVKPMLMGEALVRSGVDATGASLMGVDPAVEKLTSPLADKIVEGEFLHDDDGTQALIGVDLAERLDIEVGSKFVVSANDVDGELVAQLLHVRGIFRTGEPGMDGFVLMIPLPAARSLYSLPDAAVTRLAVVLEDSDDMPEVLAAATPIAKSIQGKAYPWQEIQPALADYVRMDRGSGLVFAYILIAISLFTIFNTVLMSVLERRREIAVRFALGTPRWSIALQLLFECLVYGAVGCAVGTAIAVGILWPYLETGMDLSAMYGDQDMSVASFAIDMRVRPSIELSVILDICGTVTGLTCLTSIPAFMFLARLNIVEELRA